jgi:solute:Na+ symporter, SSS family
MSPRMSGFDLSIILAYLIAIATLGCWAGRVRRSGGAGSHYFLAGNTLTWPVIGLAMFAANISISPVEEYPPCVQNRVPH